MENYQTASSSTEMAAYLYRPYIQLQTILQMITEILVLVHISFYNNVIEDRVTEWHIMQLLLISAPLVVEFMILPHTHTEQLFSSSNKFS